MRFSTTSRIAAGLGGITPAFVYHAARDVFPHNPRRKVHLLDRGEFFFPPDRHATTGSGSSHASASSRASATCSPRRAGRRPRAASVSTRGRSSCTPTAPTSTRTASPCNAFGDLYPADLCPANPDVRAYVRALVADVCALRRRRRSSPSRCTTTGSSTATTTSATSSSSGRRPATCSASASASTASRARPPRRRRRRRACGRRCARSSSGSFAGEPRRRPSRASSSGTSSRTWPTASCVAYLDVRAETVTSLAAEAAEVAAADGKPLRLHGSRAAPSRATRPAARREPGRRRSRWRLGVDLRRARSGLPRRSRCSAYAADVDRVRLDLEAYRGALGDCPVAVALRPSPPDCDERREPRREAARSRASSG